MKTAIHNKKPSPAVVWLYENGYFDGVETILDYGAGYGRNAVYLRSKGFKVFAYDPFNFVRNSDGFNSVSNMLDCVSFNLILTSYVLNVVSLQVQNNLTHDLKIHGKKQIHIVRNEDLYKIKPVKFLDREKATDWLIDGVETTKGLQRLVFMNPNKFKRIRTVNGYKIYQEIV